MADRQDRDHDVVIAGAGPAGMMLAAELVLAGIDVLVVEPRDPQEYVGSRAGGLHSRTIEVLEQRGVADRVLEAGTPAQVVTFAGTPLDISDFPSRHPYGLALWQDRFDAILRDWVGELGVPIRRGSAVTGFEQDALGVDVALADGERLRCAFLVGCDGGRSTVRRAAGIDFPGWPASTSLLLAEVEMDGDPEFGYRRDRYGVHALGPIDGGRVRVVLREETVGTRSEVTLEDLRRVLIGARGTDYGLRSASWLSRFTDATRQAATYRSGRVLLAGDAAHIHFPVGGQGLNLGVQDAVNLGWKLAQVIRGVSPESLLDTYEAERHPVAARVLRTTMAQTPLTRADDRLDALRDVIADLLTADEARRRMAGLMSGLDIRYDLGDGHQLVGRRMPDLDLATAGGVVRMSALLHEARPVLVDLTGTARLGGWAERVRLVTASTDGPWDLPVIGAVPAPAAVLVRPDGHVAWAGEPADPGLEAALTTWFGPDA